MVKNKRLVVLLTVFFLCISVYLVYQTYYQYSLPKTIWLYWDTAERPELINEIIRYNAPKFIDWNVIFLNKENVFNYVDRSQIPNGFNDLIVQHQSDWFRLYLLKKYGGCWLDMSIIVNNKSAFDTIWQKSQLIKSDLTGFVNISDYFTHKSGIKIPKLFDNWFIMAPKRSTLINLWFAEFDKAVSMGLLNYKKQCIADGIDISRIHFSDESDVYLTQHICIEKVLQTIDVLPSVYFIPSNDSMLKLQEGCKWENACVLDKMLHDPETKKLPYIKLIRHNRNQDFSAYFRNQT